MRSIIAISLTMLFVVACWKVAEARTFPERLKDTSVDIRIVEGGVNKAGIVEAHAIKEGGLV